MSRPVILCVDDERIILSSLKAQLLNNIPANFRIELAESAEEALEIVDELIEQHSELPLVIADQIMPGIKGDELLAKVKERLPDTLTIMLTGQATADAVGKAVNKAGLFRYLSKPWDEEDLILTVQTALDTHAQRKRLLKQTHYQDVLNHTLMLALQPILFEQQITEALSKLLETPCFNPPAEGTIYFQANSHVFLDARQETKEETDTRQTDTLQTKLRRFCAFNTHNLPEHMTLAAAEQPCSIEYLVQGQSVSDHYYRCPIIADNQLIGLLYIFLRRSHQHSEQIESFLASFCHSLSSMFRLSASNFELSKSNRLLERHKEELELLVEQRTEALENALKHQEEHNIMLLNANNELSYYATMDSLTDLMNRRFFFEQANLRVENIHLHKQAATLAMIDLDYFKEINDTYGHQAGDNILRIIAQLLREHFNERCLIGRVGGEEFAIFMPETSVNEAVHTCKALLETIANKTVSFEDNSLSITASVGLSGLGELEATIEKAINRADKALYDSKHKGRNMLSIFGVNKTESETPAC